MADPFDPAAYPDSNASDPRRMGWMQGSPPPRERQIRFADGGTGRFPERRWALSHLREFMPTANVWRGAGLA